MAVVPWEIESISSGSALPEGVRVVKWTLANGDTGTPYLAPNYPDKSVQVSGTPGAGGAAKIEGSNVPPTGTPVYGTLNDATSTALTYAAADVTANKIDQILENCVWIRPNCTAGDGTTAIVFRLFLNTVARR